MISLRPERPVPGPLPTFLPGTASVTHQGDKVVVRGTDAAVEAVTSLIVREGLAVRRLGIVDATLDDAFLSITARSPAEGR